MAAHIKIQPSNHEFWLEGNDAILDAGVRAGLALNYGCANGNCGLCKARIISGKVKKTRHHDYVLSEAEKNRDYVLMCSCTAVSDVILEALEASSENDIPLQKIATRIKRIEQTTDKILILHVQTPRIQRLRFLAGQSVTLSLDKKTGTDFPIASCPCDDRNLLFHIPCDSDKPFVQALIHNSKKGDTITVVGPHGHFLFNESARRAQLYLAYGTGFAPIKSLIEHAMALETASTMSLFWVADKKEDLYMNNLCRSWEDALDNFNYHPVIDTDAVEYLLEKHGNLETVDVYIAGSETLTHCASEKLLAAGLPDAQLTLSTID
ncbi:MAG: 2Fe-2S iron-sulfur cluster-binding protein [Gammaproteobacteria bacterium]|nr:2Fe-2S iron-sulfur cluster-binding protein [Gammaproteobacteria bacterium]MCF6338925.1 2Fe-2S iron-sulfur cluster-binding protein [Gammaproteobacteria bacterium]